MAKYWYRAVCDKHKEFIDVMVNNPSCTASYLSDYDVDIQEWLERQHFGCDLRLVHRDDQLDNLYENNYTDMSKAMKPRIFTMVAYQHICDPHPSDVMALTFALEPREISFPLPGCLRVEGSIADIETVLVGFPDWKAAKEGAFTLSDGS